MLQEAVTLLFLKEWAQSRVTMVMYIYILFVPRALAKAGDIKTPSSVCPSLCPSVRLSVTKTLTWLISSEVLKIEHWYLACMVLVTNPFNWHHAVTLTLTFDLFQGQICCRAGDHNSPNLLVAIKYVLIFKILALIALNILETFVKVLDKLVPDTVNVNVYCVL